MWAGGGGGGGEAAAGLEEHRWSRRRKEVANCRSLVRRVWEMRRRDRGLGLRIITEVPTFTRFTRFWEEGGTFIAKACTAQGPKHIPSSFLFVQRSLCLKTSGNLRASTKETNWAFGKKGSDWECNGAGAPAGEPNLGDGYVDRWRIASAAPSKRGYGS